MAGNDSLHIEIDQQAGAWPQDWLDATRSILNHAFDAYHQQVKDQMQQADSPLQLSVPQLSILLGDNDLLQALNQQWRGKDKPTNVLSFPNLFDAALMPNMPILLGDIALSYDYIMNEAHQQQKAPLDHYSHLLIHGLLHLLGETHDQEDDAAHMEGLEIAILAQINIKNPYEM
ncbi:MAG: rRNA maturation RNase YbeY [Alphaproteobacteria bacterium]